MREIENNFHNKNLGELGENKAINFLTENGYNILERNFRAKNGEIDIIAKEKDEYVFIEVKTRASMKYGMPVEAVDKNKREHILKASKYYIYKNYLQNKYIRFDIIEVYINKNNYLINHIKNAFF